MMRLFVRSCVAIAAAAFCASPVFAADINTVMSEADRVVPGGRSVEVVVPQAEIGAGVNLSYAGDFLGGGLFGALIDVNIEIARGKAAQAAVTPLRTELVDFDADQMAIDTTKAAVSQVPWFQGGEPVFAHDPTALAKGAFLSSGASDQAAFFDFNYDTSPDFSSIRVGVTVTIAKKGPTGNDPRSRLEPRNLVFAQSVTSVVQLPDPGDAQENAARWQVRDGEAAKRALVAGFREAGILIPRALTLTDEDVKRMDAGERKTVGGVSGQVVEGGPGGTLLFNKGLIHVQTLQD
jgi:hypothetical protein